MQISWKLIGTIWDPAKKPESNKERVNKENELKWDERGKKGARKKTLGQ